MLQKGERRKQQIIDTAKEMFLERGYQSTHIGQVCKKLDIARGTVYQYFGNKKEILYALVDNISEKIKDLFDIDLLRDYLKTEPAREDIVSFINKRLSSGIEILLNEPIIIKLIYKDIPGVDSKIIKHVNKALEAIKDIIAKEIIELKGKRFYKDDIDPFITSNLLIGGVMMIVYEYDKRGWDVLKSEVIDSITKNYLNGVLVSK
ncbi:MAG: TetR/AcrR family transcriptional regulator [Leptospirales bacterium]|nr:TetR/AcrR family transcriptional regulator [Leptospirales bacterium]